MIMRETPSNSPTTFNSYSNSYMVNTMHSGCFMDTNSSQIDQNALHIPKNSISKYFESNDKVLNFLIVPMTKLTDTFEKRVCEVQVSISSFRQRFEQNLKV